MGEIGTIWFDIDILCLYLGDFPNMSSVVTSLSLGLPWTTCEYVSVTESNGIYLFAAWT